MSPKSGFHSQGGVPFITMLAPPGQALDQYDGTKTHQEQVEGIPQLFLDAMAVREEVYGEQGIPLEAEFDEDDCRSWHWVVYASVGNAASSPPPEAITDGGYESDSKSQKESRATASANAIPVGTIRLVPPPHGENKYVKTALPKEHDKHGDADPPPSVETKHPNEPYIKLGRLAVLEEYRGLGLAKLLIDAALKEAYLHPDKVVPPLSSVTMEAANTLGKNAIYPGDGEFKGLCMIHAQVDAVKLWEKFGFAEELTEDEKVVVSKEPHWMEEGIEHMGMWKRLKLFSYKPNLAPASELGLTNDLIYDDPRPWMW